MKANQEIFSRFSFNPRIGHLGMIIAFVALAVTGLPQKFHSAIWAQNMIAAMGGIETVRVVHRWAAVLLILVGVHHLIYVFYVLFRRGPSAWLPIFPNKTDFVNFFQMMLYLVGIRKEKPLFDKFSYKEKFDYWAVFWGMFIMIGSGLVLWFPAIFTEWLPGVVVPLSKTAHSDEALLAVAAIVFWHMYNAHFNTTVFPYSNTIFTGKISAHHMIDEHTVEYARLKNINPEAVREAPKPPTWGVVIMSALTGLVITVLFLYFIFVGFRTPPPTPAQMQMAFDNLPADMLASESPIESAYKSPVSEILDQNQHQLIAEYTGPETCGECHPDHLDTATASPHSQRIAAAGPNPMLARLVSNSASAGATAPDCLLCHAADYQADNLTASAQTVRAAGGDTCQRCHTTDHAEDSIHADAGLACVSCHTSNNHQITAQVSCDNCHSAMPHQNPLVNVKHQRLDCRTCHIEAPIEVTVNTGNPVQNPVTKFFEPLLESVTQTPQFTWQAKDGSPATADNQQARIVPIVPAKILASADFDPLDYAVTGDTSNSKGETAVMISPGHGVIKEGARTCETCHGPEANFDFGALGYDEEQVDKLSAKPAEPEAMK